MLYNGLLEISHARPVSTKACKKISKPINFLTLDLETRTLIDGNLEVISSCIYDGTIYKTFYLTDYLDSDALLEATIKFLLSEKYNNYKVYIHNSSSFDIIFLFKHILELKSKGYELKVIKREDKFISITINNNNNDFTLTFYDSILLLPSSLSKLSKAFNVESKLPFNLEDNDTADLSDPNFRSRLLEYNKQDCKVLYDVIKAFNLNFIKLFKMGILESPTLPSLAFRLFKSNFLKHDIELTFSKDYINYKEAYRGGAVDGYRERGK